MRLSYIELLGEKHPMCFSLAASEELSEAFGGIENMQKAVGAKDIGTVAKAVDTILTALLKAGRIYTAAIGDPLPKELPCRPADLIDVTDKDAITAMFSAISDGAAREVEAKPKNADATQGQ